MTYEDIFCQILSEATGKPIDEVRMMNDVILQLAGSRGKLDQEIPDEKAHDLLVSLRKEFPGIRRWLISGGHMLEADLAELEGRSH